LTQLKIYLNKNIDSSLQNQIVPAAKLPWKLRPPWDFRYHPSNILGQMNVEWGVGSLKEKSE
jgi:hypothetical protein